MAAVVVMIIGVDLLLAAVFSYAGQDGETRAIDLSLALDPLILAVSVFGTLAIVTSGSVYKVIELWGGVRWSPSSSVDDV